MDPRGQVQDLQTLRKLGENIEPSCLSPEVCFDLVRDLNATKGKGDFFIPQLLLLYNKVTLT